MIKRWAAACVAAWVCVATVEPATAADTWVEVTSPHFRVVSNNGERAARDTAWQFEQIRAGITQGWPWAQVPLDRPLVIVGVKDENTFKTFAPGYYENGQSVRYSSISASGWDQHYIVMRADLLVDGGEGVNPYRTSYWTYCDLMLSSAFRSRLPIWFSRGMAAVLSNTNVTDKEVQFGRAVPQYINEFKSGGRFSLDQMFSVNRQSPEFQREVDRQRFDAQAWALVHFLLFGEPTPEGRESKINTLAKSLLAGTPSAAAVEAVYGPLPALDTAYRRYVDRGLFRYVQMKADAAVSKKDFVARPVEPADVAAIRAGYLVATSRPIEARANIAQARQMLPASPASYDVEAVLLERENKLDEARAAYEKAADLKSTSFLTYFRLATLSGRGPATAETVPARRAWLEKSAALNDSYAQTQQSLSNVLMQAGLYAEAIAPARRSVELDPLEVYARVSLASALARAGKKDEALAETRVAQTLARTEAERQAVQSIIDMINRIR